MKLSDKFEPFDIVRRNRYTYIILEKGSDRVISIPDNGGPPIFVYDEGWAHDNWACLGNLSSALSKIGEFRKDEGDSP